MGKKRGSKKRSGSIDQAASSAIQNLTASNEDLSMQRHDEEMVLSAIYGDDFSLETGAWNCPLYKIRIRPASEVTDHGSANPDGNESTKKELTLQIQLNKKYPYSLPMIQITNVVGIPTQRMSELIVLLQTKAKECADLGQVMGWELGQVVEEYLVEYMLRLEKDNEQRERDLAGQYKSKTDHLQEFDSYNIDESDGIDLSDHLIPSSPSKDALDSDIQKEMARQMEALDVAEKMRRQRRRDGAAAAGLSSSPTQEHDVNEEGEASDDDFFQFTDEYRNLDLDLPPASGSRYETDFVELAPLGRGGGGEVVKAINRLDRRIYAIKRIVLESEELIEDGFSKGSRSKNQWAIVQNQKLRREVTTISRMSHKNIVRYYQAWVECGQKDGTANKPNESIAEEPKMEQQANNDDGSSAFSWSSSSGSSSPADSISSDESPELLIKKHSQKTMEYSRSLSLDNFLEHEMKDFSNPLLFHDDKNEHLKYQVASSSQLGSDSDGFQEGSKQSFDSEKKTLYIQVSSQILILQQN